MSDLDLDFDAWGQTTPLRSVDAGGRAIAIGDRVRLRPAGNADIFDLTLRDRVGVVEAIEQDFEDRIHVAVVIEDDPGRDLGERRLPGHRFFFKLTELEPL